MSRSTVSSILRIVAVIMIFVGAIMTTQTLVSFALLDQRVPSGMIASLVFAQVSAVVWGCILFAASPRLASAIVE